MKSKSKQAYSTPQGKPVLNLSSKAIGKLVKTFMADGKVIKFKAKGHSMNPFINQTDIITISPYISKAPSAGDIIAYIHPHTNGLIIHRLIRISNDTFISKGDNCRHNDIAHKTKFILGYVSQINKKGSLNNAWLISPFKKLLAILSTTGLLLILNKFLKRIQLTL